MGVGGVLVSSEELYFAAPCRKSPGGKLKCSGY